MSAPLTFSFPDADKMIQLLSNHPMLKNEYDDKKGITKAIAELAAERFANAEKTMPGLNSGAALLIYDLVTGRCGFTGKTFPIFEEIVANPDAWQQKTLHALIDCAKSEKT